MPTATPAEMLIHFENGRNVSWLKPATGWPLSKINELATAHGYRFDEEGRIHRRGLVGGQPAAAPTSAPPVASPGDVDRLSALLGAAEKSTRAKTRSLAARIHDLVRELAGRVEDETREAVEKEQAAKVKAEAAADVDRLKKELAAAQAKVRGTRPPPAKKPSAARGASIVADIRAWARQNGHPVAGVGRVPAEVQAAYEAAH